MPSEQRSIIAKNRIHSSLHREACPPRQRGTPPGKYDERVYFDSCLVVCVILCWHICLGLYILTDKFMDVYILQGRYKQVCSHSMLTNTTCTQDQLFSTAWYPNSQNLKACIFYLFSLSIKILPIGRFQQQVLVINFT